MKGRTSRHEDRILDKRTHVTAADTSFRKEKKRLHFLFRPQMMMMVGTVASEGKRETSQALALSGEFRKKSSGQQTGSSIRKQHTATADEANRSLSLSRWLHSKSWRVEIQEPLPLDPCLNSRATASQ